jgi:hypothetical protein
MHVLLRVGTLTFLGIGLTRLRAQPSQNDQVSPLQGDQEFYAGVEA